MTEGGVIKFDIPHRIRWNYGRQLGVAGSRLTCADLRAVAVLQGRPYGLGTAPAVRSAQRITDWFAA
jgi:hypothetical protein